ncbi:MAG: carbohydrate kinase family protein [Anaerolineae bacterium]
MTEGYTLVIGAAGIDTKGYALAPLKPGTSNPGKIKSSSGGVARNVTETLARLGETVFLLSAIGDDSPGVRIKTRLQQAGINTDHIIISARHRTAAYLALYNHRKSLIHSIDDMSVLQTITPQIIYRKRSLIHRADMVALDSNLSAEAINSVMKQAISRDVPVVADPTSTSLAEKWNPHLQNLYMITPNAPEAEVLSGQTVRTRQQATAAAQTLVGLGVDIAVVTLAEKGVVYATSDTSGHIPALTTNVVDITGASDAMTAAIIFGLLNEFTIDEAVRLGASAAALTLQTEDSVVRTLTLDRLYDL